MSNSLQSNDMLLKQNKVLLKKQRLTLNTSIKEGKKNNFKKGDSNFSFNSNIFKMKLLTSDSLSLKDPKLPKLWLELSLFVEACERFF